MARNMRVTGFNKLNNVNTNRSTFDWRTNAL